MPLQKHHCPAKKIFIPDYSPYALGLQSGYTKSQIRTQKD